MPPFTDSPGQKPLDHMLHPVKSSIDYNYVPSSQTPPPVNERDVVCYMYVIDVTWYCTDIVITKQK